MNPMNKDVQLKRAATRLALREADKTAKTRSPLPARHNPMTAKGAQKKKKRSSSKFVGANPMGVAFDGGVRTLKVARNRNSMTIDMLKLESLVIDNFGLDSVAEAEEGMDLNGGLPSGWSTHTQPTTGALYYHNATSGKTLWTHPKHHIGLADGWEPVVADDGDVYFHNAGTGETVWEKPPPRDDIESGARSSVVSNHGAHIVDIESEGDELPPGWVAADHDSGGVFYHHKETGESTWEKPEKPQQTPHPVLLAAEEEAEELPPGWVAADHDSGGVFYHNELTGESAWERPLGPDAAAVEEEEAELPPGWIAVDHDSGGVFYHNKVSGESGWERPKAAPIISEEEHILPPGWVAAEHDDGGTFFFHTETGESVWERPSAGEFDFEA